MKTKIKRGNPTWRKGISGNPKGRPKNAEIELLRGALDKAKKKKGIYFLDHFVERAYESDQVAIALARKILPDRIEDYNSEPKLVFQGIDPKNMLDEELNEFMVSILRNR